MLQWHMTAYHQLGVARVLLAYTSKEKDGWRNGRKRRGSESETYHRRILTYIYNWLLL
jgi:hypothetical protein